MPLPSVGAQAGGAGAPRVGPRVPPGQDPRAHLCTRGCTRVSASRASHPEQPPGALCDTWGGGAGSRDEGGGLGEPWQARGWRPHLHCAHLGGPVGIRPGQHMGGCPGCFGRLGAPPPPAGLAGGRGAVQHGSAEVRGSMCPKPKRPDRPVGRAGVLGRSPHPSPPRDLVPCRPRAGGGRRLGAECAPRWPEAPSPAALPPGETSAPVPASGGGQRPVLPWICVCVGGQSLRAWAWCP